LALDQNLKITQNDINKSFDQLTKKNWQMLAVDRIIHYEIIIKTFDQVKSVKKFGQLIIKVLIKW
jgi:hypothetical protein